jgi:hypothetical protein
MFVYSMCSSLISLCTYNAAFAQFKRYYDATSRVTQVLLVAAPSELPHRCIYRAIRAVYDTVKCIFTLYTMSTYLALW